MVTHHAFWGQLEGSQVLMSVGDGDVAGHGLENMQTAVLVEELRMAERLGKAAAVGAVTHDVATRGGGSEAP
ncbi:phosphoribosylformylglycinamidine synthase subunit II [Sagittula stellata E-37]|uniref:Phosphoribosylformylglycinamidine synthase subunit II n=1 Tax=Sagittula stellata (strain ATCC 700073 / DSM 11524 / E-37) TaxID=388399 RepID=A3JYU1_SAGS3|nr:phosphoribosylformylglycinamidine synthase subunit II [Sagittula stellata E-37]